MSFPTVTGIRSAAANEWVQLTCPFCGFAEADSYNLCSLNIEDRDYGINAFFWCEKCQAKAILDYEIDSCYWDEAPPDKFIVTKINDDEYVYCIPLLKIARTTGSTLYRMPRPLSTDSQVRDFLQNIHRHTPGLSGQDIEQMDTIFADFVSVPVNSYNLHDAQKAYPKGLNWEHEGSELYILLEKENKIIYISGD